MCRLSEALIELCQLIGWWRRCRHQCSYVASLYWWTRHLLLRFLRLHEAAILALLLWFFLSDWDFFLLGFLCLHFGDCRSGTLFSSRWSAMEYHCFQPLCSRSIASDDPHSKWVKCMGFLHARARLFTASRNAHSAKTSISKPNTRLVVFERASSIFPHRAPFCCWELLWIHDQGLGCGARGDGERADRLHPFSPSLAWARVHEFSGWIRAWVFMS